MMRILYDSKSKDFKSKFGTLRENEACEINIHIPKHCKTLSCKLVFEDSAGKEYSVLSMKKTREYDSYEVYSRKFSLAEAGLYFYYFDITTPQSRFSLFKYSYDMTNMCEGEKWQLSCIPTSFKVPEFYMGKVMYQIFPDRFNKCGECDLSKKLKPFTVHEDTSDVPLYLPNENGRVLNNDFYGGNIKGIKEKIGYLKELGVSVIYLNPIFKAFSNHRYDTADYLKIDDMLGTEEDFVELCDAAHKNGMRIILDGVFSHTGRNSVYFDSEKIFGNGAYSNESSPYREWFMFESYPEVYTSWWGIKDLPCVDENCDSYRNFIIRDGDSVVSHWMKLGADGYRLDVADELPDSFIGELREKIKEIKNDAFLVGEVWEDASNKISYGERRRYFTDGLLDSVMNYPFRKAMIDYVTGKDDGYNFRNTVMSLAENYPADVLNCVMNIVSSHDTVRILTVLGCDEHPKEKTERATYKLSDDNRERAKKRLFCLVFLQFVLPGIPCIYYGDEIGTEGFEDPFCRSYFDWSKTEENDILNFYKKMASVRNTNEALQKGNVEFTALGGGKIEIKRKYKEKTVTAKVCINDNGFEYSIE